MDRATARFKFVTPSLAEANQIKDDFGVTVNDVVLTTGNVRR